MDPIRDDIEGDTYRIDVETIITSTCEIETPGAEIKNVELAVPVVSPEEEPILTPAPSVELMTEAISFADTDTNAPVKTITSDIETPGPEIENIEVAQPVVCPEENSISTSVETLTYVIIETPGPEMDNDEMVVPVVSPGEEPILTLAPSAELMTEVISFVETESNAPVEISTNEVIETLGSEMENVKMVDSVVTTDEEPILTPAPSTELMTEVISFVETDTNAPVETIITSDIETPGPEVKKVEV
ncbi:mucin-17-like, partial [Aphis craccivora]